MNEATNEAIESTPPGSDEREALVAKLRQYGADGIPLPDAVAFTPAAEARLTRFCEDIAERQEHGAYPAAVGIAAGMAGDTAERLARLRHLLFHNPSDPVSIEPTAMAEDLVRQTLTEVYENFSKDAQILAAGLDHWLVAQYAENGGEPLTSDYVVAHWPDCGGETSTLFEALDVLEQLSLVSMTPDEPDAPDVRIRPIKTHLRKPAQSAT